MRLVVRAVIVLAGPMVIVDNNYFSMVVMVVVVVISFDCHVNRHHSANSHSHQYFTSYSHVSAIVRLSRLCVRVLIRIRLINNCSGFGWSLVDNSWWCVLLFDEYWSSLLISSRYYLFVNKLRLWHNLCSFCGVCLHSHNWNGLAKHQNSFLLIRWELNEDLHLLRGHCFESLPHLNDLFLLFRG